MFSLQFVLTFVLWQNQTKLGLNPQIKKLSETHRNLSLQMSHGFGN